MSKSNIALIGMPSSGKSTVGAYLAKVLDMNFIDTDLIIRERAGKPLKDIVNDDGLDRFLKMQEDVLMNLKIEDCIVATGGSAVYGSASMNFLKEKAVIVFLKLGYNDIEKRITSERRFARNAGQGFRELFDERMPLYKKYADITVECGNKEVKEIADEIIRQFNPGQA